MSDNKNVSSFAQNFDPVAAILRLTDLRREVQAEAPSRVIGTEAYEELYACDGCYSMLSEIIGLATTRPWRAENVQEQVVGSGATIAEHRSIQLSGGQVVRIFAQTKSLGTRIEYFLPLSSKPGDLRKVLELAAQPPNLRGDGPTVTGQCYGLGEMPRLVKLDVPAAWLDGLAQLFAADSFAPQE